MVRLGTKYHLTLSEARFRSLVNTAQFKGIPLLPTKDDQHAVFTFAQFSTALARMML
jgi:hypothetical protein